MDFVFCYGSPQDPSSLAELSDPRFTYDLYTKGYNCQLRGHYPALLGGNPEDTVRGAVYEVSTVDDPENLAAYEGSSYTTAACSIQCMDDKLPVQIDGYASRSVGNTMDLSEGCERSCN